MSVSTLDEARRQFEALEIRETHISWVLLGAEQVLKLKKPVDFGFLDFSTREARKLACDEELRLNRRLAPDVYLDVIQLEDGEPGVLMRRLADEDRADHLLDDGALGLAEVQRAADRLVRFHADAARSASIDEAATAAAVRTSVLENFEQAGPHLAEVLSAEEAKELRDWQLRFLDERSDLFQRRIEQGRIVEGHGDLRLEHLYFGGADELRILDGVEFSTRLRYLDVACDLAFLAMDLAVHRQPALAESLLARYAESSGDFALFETIDFYESYRAMVRGKIACFELEAAQTEEARHHASETARLHFRLALASERRPLMDPVLVVVMGPIASGKSTLARALGDRLAAPVISTDRVRKQLCGVQANVRLPASAYGATATARTYAAVVEGAERVLASSRSVVVDGTFGSALRRDDIHDLAQRLDVPIRFVCCEVSEATARHRLERRSRDPQAISDAGPEHFERLSRAWTAPSELPSEFVRFVRTDRSIHALVDALADFVPTAPDLLP